MSHGFAARERVWIFGCCAAAATLLALQGADRWLLRPRLDAARRDAEARDRLLRDRAAEDARGTALRLQKDRLATEAARLREFRQKGLPDPAAAQTALQRVAHRALERSGLTTQNIAYTTAVAGEKKSLRRLSAGFTVRGDYGQIKRLLSEVEAAPEFAVIDDFSLTVVGGDPGQPAASVSLQIKISVFARESEGTGIGDDA